MVGTQQFNLRWNNHTSNILQVFLEHLSSELLVDVTLSCQGRFIKAHKIILSACSPYFQEVFANHTEKHPIIILNGIRYDDLDSMIKFMYNGEVRVHEAQLNDLLAAAETLQVKGLSNVRNKYEKGEITSLNPVQKSVPTKGTEPLQSSMASKKELPTHAIKAAVALFAPTGTTTRAPNTVPTALAIASPASTPGSRMLNNSSQRTITPVPRIPNATFRAANIVNRATGKIAQGLAIATLVPVSTPASVHNTISRSTGNTPSNFIPSNVSTATATTTTTTNSVSMIMSPTTTSASVISSNCSTLKIDPTSIASIAGVHFDEVDDNASGIADKTPVTKLNTTNVDVVSTSDSSTSMETKSGTNIITESLPIANTDIKSREIEPPRVRKRRKMSHTVNELARETVFASNGTVLLEPDEAVLKNMAKVKKVSETCLENPVIGDVEKVVETNDAKKSKVARPIKQPQTSLLIKDREIEKHPQKIPRPPNAFMIFANEWRRKLAIQYPKETNTKISVRLGIMWKGLSIQAKETYYRLAKKTDIEHKRKYPNYYYSPKEARRLRMLKKNLKQNQISSKYLQSNTRSDKPDSNAKRTVNVYVNGVDCYTDSDSSEYDDQDADAVDDIEEVYGHDIEMVDDFEKADDPDGIFHETGKRTKHNKLNDSTRT